MAVVKSSDRIRIARQAMIPTGRQRAPAAPPMASSGLSSKQSTGANAG